MIWMKNGISKSLLTFLILLVGIVRLHAQADSARYDRPSLCLMMAAHPEQAFGDEIEIIFREMNIPERFNDHSLGVRVVKFPNTQDENIVKQILNFSDHVQLPKKMVAKWFSRNKQTGTFNTDLIAERGLYNANKKDIIIANNTIRNEALLADAGEKLISHTFLVLCDYSYNREYSTSSNREATEESTYSKKIDVNNAQSVDAYHGHIYQKDNRLSSFELTCTSYLFRLRWNDSVAAVFYQDYYCDNMDQAKVQAFQQDKSTFQIEYVGSCLDKETEINPDGIYTNQQLIKKTCVRLCDKNLTTLQRAHPEFRIKAPLVSTSPLKAYIGMKEGVNHLSRFEVLLPIFQKDGTPLEHPGLKPPGAKGYFRFRGLGPDYDLVSIRRRIIENSLSPSTPFLIEQNENREDQPKGYGLPFAYRSYCIRLYSFICKPKKAKREFISMAIREDIRKLDKYIAESTKSLYRIDEASFTPEQASLYTQMQAEVKKVNVSYELDSLTVGRISETQDDGSNVFMPGLIACVHGPKKMGRTPQYYPYVNMNIDKPEFGIIRFGQSSVDRSNTYMTMFDGTNLKSLCQQFVASLYGTYQMVPNDYFRPTSVTLKPKAGGNDVVLQRAVIKD